MSKSLKVLRDNGESPRFERQERDDSRTSIADPDALAADLKAVIDGEVRFDAGSRALLRQESEDTLIIADGFSCREQISQDTDRQALHTAQIIQLALNEGPAGPPGSRPEAGMVKARARARRFAAVKTGFLITAAAVGGALLYQTLNKSKRAGKARFS